jgi:hypothetical protein
MVSPTLVEAERQDGRKEVMKIICSHFFPRSTIAWKDDGTAPLAATFGTTTVGLYLGSQNTQALGSLATFCTRNPPSDQPF